MLLYTHSYSKLCKQEETSRHLIIKQAASECGLSHTTGRMKVVKYDATTGASCVTRSLLMPCHTVRSAKYNSTPHLNSSTKSMALRITCTVASKICMLQSSVAVCVAVVSGLVNSDVSKLQYRCSSSSCTDTCPIGFQPTHSCLHLTQQLLSSCRLA